MESWGWENIQADCMDVKESTILDHMFYAYIYKLQLHFPPPNLRKLPHTFTAPQRGWHRFRHVMDKYWLPSSRGGGT